MGQGCGLLEVGALWPEGCVMTLHLPVVTLLFGFCGILKKILQLTDIIPGLQMTFSDNCVHCLAPLPFGFEVAGYLDGCGEKQGLILSCRDGEGPTSEDVGM